MYFDEDSNINRAICYASNQKSPFEDEHDKNAIIPTVSFENGLLHVPKTNPVLQLILDELHPYKNTVYCEVDLDRDAEIENAKEDLALTAQVAARGLSVSQQQNMIRVIFGKDPDTLPTAVMKREIMRYAKNNPDEFMKQYNDPEVQYESKIRNYFDKKLLTFRNGQRDVFFNTTGNKSRLMIVPQGENPYIAVGDYLKEKGIEMLKTLDIELNETEGNLD